MKCMPSKVLASFLLALTHLHIHAQSVGDIFGAVNYTKATSKDESSRNLGTYKPNAVGVGLSYVIFKNLAVEGNVFTGAGNSSNALSATSSMTLQIKNGYGFSLRPFLAFNDVWGGFVKLGRQYGTQDSVVNRSTVQSTTSASYAHTVYGIGLSYNINRKWAITSDYTSTVNVASEMTKTSALGFGLRYKF